MPQTLSEPWMVALGGEAERVHAEALHVPGNLTLSGYNQELSNQGFEKKRVRFAQSNISLTRQLAEVEIWDADVIERRGRELAREAAVLWPGPAQPHVPRAGVSGGSVDINDLRLRFWTGLAERLAESDAGIPVVEPRPSMSIRLPATVRLIGIKIRHRVQPKTVGIELRFRHEVSRKLWEILQANPDEFAAATGGSWAFEQNDSGNASMTQNIEAATDDEGAWPDIYDWIVGRLERLYTHGVPLLREGLQAMGQSPDVARDSIGRGDLSSTKQQQLAFWTALADAIVHSAPNIHVPPPRPRHWQTFSAGRTEVRVNTTVRKADSRIGVELLLAGDLAKQRFAQLHAKRGLIEERLGESLDWQELPNATASRIALFRFGCPLDDEGRWGEYTAWMVEWLVKFDEVFRPLVKELP